MARPTLCLWLATIWLALPAGAAAEPLEFGGRVQSDLRVRPRPLQVGPWYDPHALPAGFSRNQNVVKVRLRGDWERVAAVADVDFMWIGLQPQVQQFSDLSLRERIDPYRLKAHAAYVELHDMGVAGLDLRIGQQVVNWGTGDQFNPTNTINANTFEDPLLFGQQLANSMVRLDYAAAELVTASVVLVPVFKPALLPDSAALALADLRRMPILQGSLRRRLQFDQEQAAQLLQRPTVVQAVLPEMPPTAFDNAQGAARLGFTMGSHDVALSYYVGRSDMPQPRRNDTVESDVPQRDTASTQSIAGLLQTSVRLHYPRMQVLGLNVAGELPLPALVDRAWAPFGYHLELGVFAPQTATLRLYTGELANGQQPAGELDYGLGGAPPTVVASTPFAKWNLGLDYTLPGGLYINLQWVHGFVDEFGAGDFLLAGEYQVRGVPDVADCLDPDQCIAETLRPRLGDYLVAGVDAHFLGDAALARLFVIYDLSGLTVERWDPAQRRRVRVHHTPFSSLAASAVLFPELTYNAGNGMEISVGALAKLGGDLSKFGDPAAGGTEVWTRARYAF